MNTCTRIRLRVGEHFKLFEQKFSGIFSKLGQLHRLRNLFLFLKPSLFLPLLYFLAYLLVSYFPIFQLNNKC